MPHPSRPARCSLGQSTPPSARSSLQFVDKTKTPAGNQLLVGTVSPVTAAEQLSGTGDPLTVELINGVAYVQTSAKVLQNDLGLSAAGAATGAGKWISVQSTDSAFSLLTQDLTITTELQNFVPVTNLRIGRVKVIGKKKVVTISGGASTKIVKGAKGSAFLVVSAKAPYLPLEGGIALRNGSYQLNEAAAFTNWDKRVALTAPSDAVTYASLVSQG